jgi:hypothetical protein
MWSTDRSAGAKPLTDAPNLHLASATRLKRRLAGWRRPQLIPRRENLLHEAYRSASCKRTARHLGPKERPEMIRPATFALLVVTAILAAFPRAVAGSDDASDARCHGTHSVWLPLSDECLGVIDTDRPHQTDTARCRRRARAGRVGARRGSARGASRVSRRGDGRRAARGWGSPDRNDAAPLGQ